jgi:hypothetical protein
MMHILIMNIIASIKNRHKMRKPEQYPNWCHKAGISVQDKLRPCSVAGNVLEIVQMLHSN